MGVSAGVSIYKSLELVRRLKDQGADVHVIMTGNATNLIQPQLFEAISGNPVYSELFGNDLGMKHIALVKAANLILIAPATANIIAKLAYGFADDLLSSSVLAFDGAKLICPAMNEVMWQNFLVQENIARLRVHGFEMVGPSFGEMACGSCGVGRLEEVEYILFRIEKALTLQILAGKEVLVSAGPTWEKIDPIRFISNFSSGKMGYALAKSAALRGAKVVLVSGPVSLLAPDDVQTIQVESALEMEKALLKQIKSADIFISAAAVSDFRPRKFLSKKLKKESIKEDAFSFELIKNPDILKKIAAEKTGLKKSLFRVGFALETGDLLKNARRKLKEKELDMIIANQPANLGAEEKEIMIMKSRGAVLSYKGNVEDAAEKIWEEIIKSR